MGKTIIDLINEDEKKAFAITMGNKAHLRLQTIDINNSDSEEDNVLIDKIKSNPVLSEFFSSNAKTEVPIAGIIDGHFVSKRIDRLIINNEHKNIIKFMDYKTDTNKQINKEQYLKQISEYRQLLQIIYPEHQIFAYIFWLTDLTLEQVF